MKLPSTRKELIRQLREKYPCQYRMYLKFEDVRIELQTNSEPLLEELQDYFGQFNSDPADSDIIITAHQAPEPRLDYEYILKEPDSGKKVFKEEYEDFPDGRIVRKRITGMIFVFGGSQNLAIGPCTRNPNQVINFINNRYIDWQLRRGCILGHAAAVTFNGRGLAIAGNSGMGKSTLALHVVSMGASFVSNDRLLVEKTGEKLTMHGVAKLPRINPGTALNNPFLKDIVPEKDMILFEHYSKEDLWDLEHKYDVFIDKCFGEDRFKLNAPMDGLLILNWKRGNGSPKLKRLDVEKRSASLSAFIKSPGLFYFPEKGKPEADLSLQNYKEFLSRCDVFEIEGGLDFERATDICLDYLSSKKVPALK
ncbi:MAG: HprK-related kinase B [candidate division Zixibacteria bacterium]|nr:HprK-related kinase B [candidate division Zixibacteria bacterium]